jgi:hypothetical protein
MVSKLSSEGFSTQRTICTSFATRMEMNPNRLHLLLTLMNKVEFGLNDLDTSITEV